MRSKGIYEIFKKTHYGGFHYESYVNDVRSHLVGSQLFISQMILNKVLKNIELLHGAMIFTKIDLRYFYYQIRVRVVKHLNKIFRIHYVHFEFQVVPSCLSIPPNYFSKYHEWNFQNLIKEVCSCFL